MLRSHHVILRRSTYQSKIDPWALPLLAVVPLIPALAALLMHEPVAYLSFAVFVLLYVLLVFPVSYRLESEALLIHSGILRWRVPYVQMRSVQPTRGMLAIPAMSLDRFEILYGAAGRALISPRDRRAFLADLHARAPQLQLPTIPDPGKR